MAALGGWVATGVGRRAEWRRHWPVVVAALSGVGMSTILTYSSGLFIEPLEREFGWTRGEITFGQAIAAATAVLLNAPVGIMIDRFGPRRIGLFGLVSVGLLTALLATAGPGIGSWWTLWCLLAVAFLFMQPTIWTAAVSSLFAQGRGLAIAVTLSGSGIASFVTPLLTYELIARFGWRVAFVGLALFWSAIVIPIVLLLFKSAKDAPGIKSGIRAETPARSDRAGLRQLCSRRFVQLALGGFLFASVVVPFATSLVPILSSNNLSRGEAAGIASVLGFSSITGRLTVGFLLDRLPGRFLAAASLMLPIVSSLLLLGYPGSTAVATVAVLVLGLALGAELDIVAYLASRYFDLANFGLLFGTIAGFISLAGGAGPWAISLIFDSHHSYRPALWLFIPLALTAATLFLLLGPYPAAANAKDGAA